MTAPLPRNRNSARLSIYPIILLPNLMFESSPLILLIEDDPVFRRLMVAYLELWGARVIKVDNGDKGIWQAGEQAPDLVLINLLLTAPNGLEVIACLKQRYPVLPVIAISARLKMADVAQALRAGAEDYLIKPIRNWRQVFDAIAACLRPDPRGVFDELNEHLAFFRREDMAASRLCRGLCQLPERDLAAELPAKHPLVADRICQTGSGFAVAAGGVRPIEHGYPRVDGVDHLSAA